MDAIVGYTDNFSIRADATTKKGSVIDVIRSVLGCSSSAANTNLSNLKTRFSDLGNNIAHAQINGKGKSTPVADAKTLVEIIFLLPGQKACKFRRKSAEKVCRLMGGDMSLVVEIEQRCTALESTPEGRATQAFLLNPGSSENSSSAPCASAQLKKYEGMPAGFSFLDPSDQCKVAKEVVQQALDGRKQALDSQKQALKRQRCEDMVGRYKTLMDIGVKLDDRTKIEIRDNVSLLTKRDLALEGSQDTEICAPIDPTTPTHTLCAGERGHETGIVVVAAKMGVRVPPAMSGAIGKLMKKLYKKKYGLSVDWDDFPKRQTLFHGRPINENCYYARDEDIIEEAIKTKMKM
ncbi:unknown [Feldmannia species virus]|uniref:Uncharacterized protein n=1 Tax=Feldmannia species virus TaxID=39420 RepID=B5LWG1_9PHYC|nr:hypothetical protein FeldSpV_gp072 [Feldmannia species virus]ACH46824.1 unknown [Feldmannia species virus]